MTEVSVPARRSAIAVECRSVCGVTFLLVSDGQVAVAVWACLATRCPTASRLSGLASVLFQPGPQGLGGEAGQRGAAVFASFPVAAQVRAGPEVDVGEGEAGQLADAQPGADGD